MNHSLCFPFSWYCSTDGFIFIVLNFPLTHSSELLLTSCLPVLNYSLQSPDGDLAFWPGRIHQFIYFPSSNLSSVSDQSLCAQPPHLRAQKDYFYCLTCRITKVTSCCQLTKLNSSNHFKGVLLLAYHYTQSCSSCIHINVMDVFLVLPSTLLVLDRFIFVTHCDFPDCLSHFFISDCLAILLFGPRLILQTLPLMVFSDGPSSHAWISVKT